jgi:uncharacterized protein
MELQTLSEKVQLLSARFREIQLVYLFGSRVDGEIGPMSDFDFGILLLGGKMDVSLQANLAHEIAMILQTDRVDVVILNRSPIEFQYNIIAKGRRLYERDVETRVEFEANVLSRYFDYLPILRAQRDQILLGDEYDRRVQRYRKAFRRTERTLGKISPPKK